MSFKNTSLKYPPNYGVCPDYWEITSEKKCTIPNDGNRPTGTLSTSNTPGYNTNTIDFNDNKWNTLYLNKTKQCALRKWTNDYKVEWDGISNYNNC